MTFLSAESVRLNFPLREITKFIRHKVNKCNKENVENDTELFGGDGDNDEANTISTKRTPISATMTRKESSVDGNHKWQRLLDAKIKTENDDDIGDLKDVKDRLPFRLKQIIDVDTTQLIQVR
jgi:hypothetical protein